MWPIATGVARSMVSVSVCMLGTWLSCAKMAEPIKMPFGGLTCMGPRNHALDGLRSHRGRGNYWGLFSQVKSIGTLLYCRQQKESFFTQCWHDSTTAADWLVSLFEL